VNEKELLEFIAQIIACGIDENIKYSFIELRNIIEREGADRELVTMMTDLIVASPEAAQLGEKKHGAPVTMDEIGKVIRDGRERKRRQDAYRC